MSIAEFGGNLLERFTLTGSGKQLLGSGPYEYFYYGASAGEDVRIEHLGSCCAYLLSAQLGVRVVGAEHGETLEPGDCIIAEGEPLELHVQGGGARLLVAGTTEPHPERHGVFLTRHRDLYRVSKPWGHELWINGEHPRFALKQIMLRAGNKTSLQYHRFKHETNLLLEGRALLHYKASPGVDNDAVTPADIASVPIEPVTTVGVRPPTLHRLQAVSDILLYETSTPHLDDVVRVSDDTRRPDGRVDMEHRR